MKLSVIVPVYNEEGNVQELHRRIAAVCEQKTHWNTFEILFVNDGSSDATAELMKSLTPLTSIHFRKNFGQTAALDAGVKQATGDVLVMLDGDLQNPPEEIPKLLEELQKGYDVVSGWRKHRKDSFGKRFVSRVADKLRSVLVKDDVHDSGCTLKAYRAECFDGVDLYGEMHRFLPAILSWSGFRVGEVVVRHEARTAGISKYNWKRTIKGFVDMLGIWFWRKYASRPLHLFGGSGIVLGIAGALLLCVLAVLRIFWQVSIGDRVWVLVGFVCIMTGIQLFVAGILADLLIKNYFTGRKEHPYAIRSVERRD